MLRAIAWGALLGSMAGAVWPCPTDTEPRAGGVVLTVGGAGVASLLALDMPELDKMPATRLTQRHTVSSSAPTATDASNASDQSTVYSGVLLRDVVARAGFGAPTDRGARVGVVEAVATDGYRAVFSWGELFNSPAGEHVLIVRTLNGRTLDAAAGPLALRALADLRPGPRHVRNLCALLVRSSLVRY